MVPDNIFKLNSLSFCLLGVGKVEDILFLDFCYLTIPLLRMRFPFNESINRIGCLASVTNCRRDEINFQCISAAKKLFVTGQTETNRDTGQLDNLLAMSAIIFLPTF